MKIIQTTKAPKAIGPYSQAVRVGDTVYLSGQIPLHPDTLNLEVSDFKLAAHRVFLNLQAVCEAASGSLADIVKLTIYLIDLADFATLNEVMQHYFQEPYPARATVQVAALPKGVPIEMDAIMMIKPS